MDDAELTDELIRQKMLMCFLFCIINGLEILRQLWNGVRA